MREKSITNVADATPTQKKVSLPKWLWDRCDELAKQIGVGRSSFIEKAIESFIIDHRKWWNSAGQVGHVSIPSHDQLTSRIEDLEAGLERVLREARGDGREATTPEYQMVMRTGQAILDNKLKK